MDQETEISGKDPIRLNNVIFTYGSEKSKRIIKGLSLDIPAGKTTAIVGLSGSGKTTMLRCLNFLEKSDGGTMLFDDQRVDLARVTHAEANALRRRVTQLFTRAEGTMN